MSTSPEVLREYMSSLSKKYFHEEWKDGLEYALWEWMQLGIELEATEIFKLDNMSSQAGVWIGEEEVWDLVDWQIHFEIGDW